MSKRLKLLGLDVGSARIGVAFGDSDVKIAIPHGTLVVDGSEIEQLAEIVIANEISRIVIGYPRNQSGEPTQQTAYVETFAQRLVDFDAELYFQDESLTSVIAEKRLQDRGVLYEKGDIDSEAAVIILQDYMEQQL